MPIKCLTAGRMTMQATLLHQSENYTPVPDLDIDQYGEWVDSQSPLSGQIVKVWKPYPNGTVSPSIGQSVTVENRISCIARGIVDGGIRVAGTTERFGDSYENIDFVKMWTPPSVRISKRDRVTNIRDPRGNIIWVDEEYVDIDEDNFMQAKATVFNVNGVTPLLDAFNRHVENFVLLERAAVYGED